MALMHLKTSFQYIRRSPFQALAAILVLSLTFFVATLASMLVYSSSEILKDFESRPQVIAFLKKDTPSEKSDELLKKISEDPRISDAKLVSKEEAMEIYKNATSENPLLGELVSPSIFPSSIEFSVKNLELTESIIDEVRRDEIVESVGYTASLGGDETLSGVLDKLKTITSYVRLGGLSIVSILGATSFLVLMVVIGMRIQTRKSEMETLSLIGATKSFITTPIIFEALFYGIIGSFLGWLIASICVLYATPALLSYFGEIPVLPKDTVQFFGLLLSILGVELIAGIVIAFMGSLVAISRRLA